MTETGGWHKPVIRASTLLTVASSKSFSSKRKKKEKKKKETKGKIWGKREEMWRTEVKK